MQKKYLVLAGFVRSKKDGQEHFISCERLIDLYGVDPNECICIRHPEYYHRRTTGLDLKRFIRLTPLKSGDYLGTLERALKIMGLFPSPQNHLPHPHPRN